MEKKSKIKKVSDVVQNVLLYSFLIICIAAVFLTVMSKKDIDGAAEVFGYQMRVVVSDSMAKCEHTDVSQYKIKDIPIRSMVFVEVIPEEDAAAQEWYRSLKVGDVLTFRYVYTTQVTITHRIVSINEKETGGFIIELAGDNTNSESGQLHQVIDTSIPNSTNYVIGRVTGQSYIFGLIMSLLMQPIFIVLVIILPCAIIILLEVIKIFKMFSSEKKQREQAEKEEKDNELEELRRKLAELESLKNAQSVPKEEKTDENDTNSKET